MNIIKSSFFIPIVILSIIFSLLTMTIVNTKYKQSKELYTLTNNINHFKIISKLVHEIQIERGLSSGYLASQGTVFKKDIKIQREYTKKAITNFTEILNGQLSRSADTLKPLLLQIEEVAHKVDTLNISLEQTIEYYSNINNILLQNIVDMGEQSTSIGIRNKILSYSHFLKLKENAGIQRALGTKIILLNKTDLKSKYQYHKIIVKYNMHREKFLSSSEPEISSYYKSHLDPKIDLKIVSLSKIILESFSKSTKNIDINIWFDTMSKKINLLKTTEDYLTSDILEDVRDKLSKHNTNIIIFIFISLFSIVLFIYMIMKIISILSNEKMLKDMIDKYIIFSITDLKGTMTSVSSAFCKISGYSREELIGKNHNIIRHQDMKNELFKKMWKTIEKGKTFNGNIKNRTKEGGYYWVNANIEPIFNSKGNIESYIAIRSDITDKKMIEELNISLEERIECEVKKSRQKDQQIIEQSKFAQMGEMISMIAHQWRQPLSAIASTSASLEVKAKLNKLDNDIVIKQASNISKYIHHLSETINDFRDFFKPVKEKQNIVFDDVVHSVLNIVGKSIESKNISIVKKLDSKEHFQTYSNELKQVILNLLKNAEDILLEKKVLNPMITITTSNNILSISDNGGGVPEDIIDKIFNPYFSTKLNKNGTGLGLYMSKTIIEEHCDGELSVRNDENGAVFSIELKYD